MLVHKQTIPNEYVTLKGDDILNPGQPAFACAPECMVLRREAVNTKMSLFWPDERYGMTDEITLL